MCFENWHKYIRNVPLDFFNIRIYCNQVGIVSGFFMNDDATIHSYKVSDVWSTNNVLMSREKLSTRVVR